MIEISPALPGPVLLAEIAAPFDIVTDWPAVREMFPPEPESGVIPIDRLEIPPGVPFTIVPDSSIRPVAETSMLPPWPLLVVPLSIRPPF
jgi:hypothetical protein